jgi:hypothetical protein
VEAVRGNRARAIGFAATLAMLTIVAPPGPAAAQDDWHVVERHSSAQANSPASAPRPPATAQGDGPVMACGEHARPAGEPYRGIMHQLDDMYGENYRIYESVEPYQPHARTGGCIFYNRKALAGLLGDWMSIKDDETLKPMLYAIFSHEFAHELHGDVNEDKSNGSVKNQELAADRFAGYTLARLGIPRLDPDQLTFYYRVIGDDYLGGGGPNSHGTSTERTTAFEYGWNRAQMGLPEAGGEPAAGFGQP